MTPRPFFHEFAIQTPITAGEVNRRLLERGIIGGFDLGSAYLELERALLLCCTELTTAAQIDRLAEAMRDILAGEKER
jgi:glycine dehydrogenase subunit 1